jgi:flagellar hook-associated protein 2
MAGAISSLGLGSGTLTSDVIDKLKAADSSNLINPITRKATQNSTRQNDLTMLTTLLSSLKGNVSDLGTDSGYLKRTATSSSTAVGITVADGVSVQSSSMTVSQLAKNDILQSSGFASRDNAVSLTSGYLKLRVGTGSSYAISIESGSTLEQIAQKINDGTGGDVSASIMNTGSATNPYKLIMKSTKSGEEYKISASEVGTGYTPVLGLDTPKITASAAITPAAGTIADGDIKINGVSIGALTLSASTSAESNAQTIVDAINYKTSSTGVTAFTDNAGKLRLSSDGRGMFLDISGNGSLSKLATGQVGPVKTANATTPVPATDTIVADGDIKINGTSIGAVTTLAANTAEQNAQLFKTAINAISTTTGVSAFTDGSGKLRLASDGRAISLTTANSGGANSGLQATDSTSSVSAFAKLQYGQNAKFNFNGIDMQRSTNVITDAVTGATFTLANTSSDLVNLSITQDTASLKSISTDFVKNFNALSSKLSELTKYDPTTKATSSFSGVSEVTNIYSSLASTLTLRDSSNNSLMDYGFSLDKNGQLSLNSTTLDSKISADSTALEKLFKGVTKVTEASYTANKTATTTALTSSVGDIKINGIDIRAVTTLATNTSEQNAQLFVSAINALYSDTGVKAYTNGSGKLVLKNTSGGQIQLESTTRGATMSGLSSSATSNVAYSKAVVAYGSSKSEDGIFAKLNNQLKELFTNTDSTLTTYDTHLTDESKNLNDEKIAAQARLDSKYELMSSRFAIYDSMIAKYQQSFSSLQQQINSAGKA